MAEKFSRWDAIDDFKNEEDIALYFAACIEEDPGNGSLICAALGDIARARGISQLANAVGLASDKLNQALSINGNPEFSTVIKVINALGLKLHATSPKSLIANNQQTLRL